MAMAHGLANHPSEAVRALKRAAEIQPDDVFVRYEIARYAIETGSSSSSSATCILSGCGG